MSRRFQLLLCVLLSGAVLLPVVGRAQDLTPDRVRMALDVTDARIEQAQRLASESGNAQAQGEVTIAADVETRAKSALAAAQLALALRLTFESRTHADRAIALVKGLPDPDQVRAQLERTRERLDRARERIDECANDRARSVLRAAAEMQAHAEGAAQSGRYLAALQLTMSARERTLRALRLCRLEENPPEGADRAVQRTDEVLSRARESVAGAPSEPARRALARAVGLQDEATRQLQAGHAEAALRLTMAARTFAHRAIRLSGAPRR